MAELDVRVTCPVCGQVTADTMPIDRCVIAYDCPACQAVLRPKDGDCCVFCSYGDRRCPPIQARQLYDLLQPLTSARCPFANLPNARQSHWYEGITAEDMTKITWLKPKVAAEFAFTEWTAEGLLRHARYVDLRPDVEAPSVRRQM